VLEYSCCEMNARYPHSGFDVTTLTGVSSPEHREAALLREIEALKAENQRLRKTQVQTLGASSCEDVAPETPLLLQLTHQVATVGKQEIAVTLQMNGEAMLAALSSVFPIGIFRTDVAGNLTHVDESLQRIFGLRADEFPAMGWLKHVHADDRERVRDTLIRGARQAIAVSVEFRFVRPENKALVHLMARNLPVRNAQGELVAQHGFVQDISSLRSLEQQVAAKDALNQQIIESSPDCAKVLDLQGRVLKMTAQGCRLVEVDDFEQVRNSDWITWWPDEGQLLAQKALKDALGGDSARFLALGKTFKGTPKWWDTVISPIRDAQGEVEKLLAVSRDVSAQHQQQQEIRALNNELEARVEKRTKELAEANRRLQSTLENAQALYNQAPCGYHSVDIDGICVSINDTELQWLGYSRGEVVRKKRFQDFVLPQYVAQMEDRLKLLTEGKALEGMEYEIRRRDGSTFFALLSSSAVRDPQGRFLRSNTTVVDISHRKQAEIALRNNQRFLQAITDHFPGLVAYLDDGLRFRFANAEHRAVYGMDPATVVGKELSECIPSDVWDEVAPRMRNALLGHPQHFEAWRRKVDGTQIAISASYLPDIHEGVVKGVFVQIEDITDRKRVEDRVKHLNDELERKVSERSAELLESEQRFRLMVDTLREYCVFFLDVNGYITDWTDSAQRMEGYSPSEMLGRHYAALFNRDHPETGRAKAEKALRLAASRGQHEVNNWHTRKDGSKYWTHSLLVALRDNQGDLIGFAKINRDMSDAKRLDDLMRNINEELENRVAERTEQLLAANKDLESFSYSVSHDLRSPLRHISSFVSLLEEHLGGTSDETIARYLGTIGTSARHMGQLIDGLLAFSRLGRAAINLAPVDLSMLVGTVVAQMGHDTEGRVVDWVVAPDLPVVQGDALLLREVWANLLGNAYKYSRTRERTRIEVGWSVDPAAGYTFFVRDNGVGFDTKYATKLFGVFQRLHRASEFEGTGIGLALTRRIVERHGGSIWAESQLGEGSVFSFSLPFEGLHASESKRDSMFAELTL
jgi:PAS domain S-box-containing protein